MIGRLKSVEFIAFETKESLPYQVKYLKTAESITFSGNSNTFLKNIVLGNEICDLVKYGNLRKLTVRAYGLVGLPANFTEFGKTLISLDLSSNNFEVMGKSGSTINGVKVLGIESITRKNFPHLRNLYLNKINRYSFLPVQGKGDGAHRNGPQPSRLQSTPRHQPVGRRRSCRAL